jgi:hypothetical protein
MSASSASAVSSSRNPRRQIRILKPLPHRKDLIKIGEDESTNFQEEGFVLPNTPQPQYEGRVSKSPSKSKQPSRSPPKSPKIATAIALSPPRQRSPLPEIINLKFERPEKLIFTRQQGKKDIDYLTIKRLNEIVVAYSNLILKFENKKSINIFSFLKILNKILKISYESIDMGLRYIVDSDEESKKLIMDLQHIVNSVEETKILIINFLKYIVRLHDGFDDDLKSEIDKLVYHDVREKYSNDEELLLLVSKDTIFIFDFKWTIHEGRIQKELNTTEIYNNMFKIMEDLFIILERINLFKSPDILRYSIRCSEWLEINKDFIMTYIPTAYRNVNRNNNDLSVSSISIEHQNSSIHFHPVIYYDIIDRKLIIDRLDYINTKIYELKKVGSNDSPLLQIITLLILIKGLLRMKSYMKHDDGKKYFINGNMKRDIRQKIHVFERNLQDKEHIIAMNMHKKMPTNEIVKLNLVKELDKIVNRMNDYYGRSSLFFSAKQVAYKVGNYIRNQVDKYKLKKQLKSRGLTLNRVEP